MDRENSKAGVGVARVPSTLSVRDVLVVPCASCPLPTTPARTRDIDTDMEALRISRQDNPFLKQVLASRESLADSLEESVSDDTNLMSQEIYGDLDTDPLSLPEVHKHMIRSPPPTSWPRSPNYKMFRFPNDSDHEGFQENSNNKSPTRMSTSSMQCFEFLHEERGRESSSCTVSPRLSLNLRPQQQCNNGDSKEDSNRGSSSCNVSPRLSLNLRPLQQFNSVENKDRCFSLLTPAPLRSLSDVRRLHSRSCEESQHLVTDQHIKH